MRKLKKYPRVVTIVLSATLALLTFIGTLVFTGVFTTHLPRTESVFENNLPIVLDETAPLHNESGTDTETQPDTPTLFN
jgi:hypothetical protein